MTDRGAQGTNLRSSPRSAARSRTAPPEPDDLTPVRRARRADIVRAALRLLGESEYDDIQIRDVAGAAGVSLGTLYRYFASKEHLFAAVLVEWSQSLDDRIEQRPLEGSDPATQLRDLCRRMIDAFDRLPQFFRLMTTIETSLDPHARRCYETFVAGTQSAFARPLGAFEPDESEAVLEVMMMVLGGVTRAWALGLLTTAESRARIDRAIDVVFSPPAPRRT
ncbi:MAG: TetR/AcrR family transcriptional regulator [Ilumatobacteraceae bacterium]